jgi:hypothetical protein
MESQRGEMHVGMRADGYDHRAFAVLTHPQCLYQTLIVRQLMIRFEVQGCCCREWSLTVATL